MARARFKLQRSFLRDTEKRQHLDQCRPQDHYMTRDPAVPTREMQLSVHCVLRSLPTYSGTVRRTTSHIPVTALLRSFSGPATGRY